jgi:hypothetical protein
MMRIIPQMRIWMAVEAVYFRREDRRIGAGVSGGFEDGSLLRVSVCFSQQAGHGNQAPCV